MISKEMLELWPELEWIQKENLRKRVASTWETALSRSALSASDLKVIPFTLLVKDLKVSFMDHKRSVVHIARSAGETINSFYGNDLPVDMDVLIAGAILIDVGKLLEYDKQEGKIVQGDYGKYLRHPFSGVSLAEEHGIGPEICHIIAAHAGEGDHIKRSTEAYIVHHADFMTFLPFRDGLRLSGMKN